MQGALSAVLGGFGADALHSAYAYGAVRDVVFASEGFADAASFAEADFIAEFKEDPRFFTWYPSHTYGAKTGRVISYVVPVPLPNTRRGSFLVVNVDASFLESVVARSQGADSFELFVLTEKGESVFVGSEQLLRALSDSDALHRLLRSAEEGHSAVEIDGTAYYAAVRASESTGWRYVTLGRRDSLLFGTERFAQVALIVAGLCVVIAAFVVLAFARVFYRPVERLTNQVQRAFDSLGLETAEGGGEHNELRRIAWEFSVLVEAEYYIVVIDLSRADVRAPSSDTLHDLAETLSVLVERADDQLIVSGGVADSFDELSVRYRSAVRLYGMRRVIVQRPILRVEEASPFETGSREAAELERAASAGRAILKNLDTSSDLVYRQAVINEVGNALILAVLTNTSTGEVFPPDSSPWALYQQLGSVEAVKEWLVETIHEMRAVLEARRQAGQSHLINKVRAEIEARYTEPITVQELADGQQITQSYLSSLFHEETGGTLSQCIAEKRLEHACRLLRETDMLVKSIAAESGCGQKQNMIRAFKRHLDLTPGEYREQYRSAIR